VFVKTWYFTRREEYRLLIFENRMQKTVLGPKRENERRPEKLKATHPLTEMSTRVISWGVKAAGA
jgi:hypothetical protein